MIGSLRARLRGILEQAGRAARELARGVLDPMTSEKPQRPARTPRVRTVSPATYYDSRRARLDRAAPQANGNRPITCSKCGFVGGNARGCGRAHATITKAVSDDEAERAAALVALPPSDGNGAAPRLPVRSVSCAAGEVQAEATQGASGEVEVGSPVADDDQAEPVGRLTFVGRHGSRRHPDAPRSLTIATKHLTRAAMQAEAIGADERAELEAARPRTRSACRDAVRPCPWVSCRHHLYLDVNPATGAIKLNFPNLEPWQLEESCALDVAEAGARTLEEVGGLMNLTRERMRQLEVRGLAILKGNADHLDPNGD